MTTNTLVLVLALQLSMVAAPVPAAASESRPWSSDLLRTQSAWPHAAGDAAITASPRGLKVEITPGRTFAIAAASGLKVPQDLGQIRVRVAETAGGVKWFVRLYGELRRPGDQRTVAIAQDETVVGERVFLLDPRLRQLGEKPLQLQLGVEGKPGAFAIFEEVSLLASTPRTNCPPRAFLQPGQKDIAAVELMPNLPAPYELIDWREKARDYCRLVFDLDARGEFLPLIWIDETRLNSDRPTFGLSSYVGSPDQGPGKTNSQEGITCMGAVLSASLIGADAGWQKHDFVTMCEAWFNTRDGLNLVLNRQRDHPGGSFWYELMPHIAFYALTDRHPEKARFTEIMRITAERWRQVCLDLAGSNKMPDFNHTSFDFRTRRPVDNGKWREPDAAAAVAWLEFAAWKKFQDSNCLAAAESCLRFLQSRDENPYYEVLLPFGVLAAARANAELGRNYDVGRLLDWCFGISDCRGGWGVTVGNWGGYDCDGLVGSIDNRGGYAFAMNTFVQAGALAPLPRYDPRYARAIGKWLLNLANSSRLFYPGALPPGHETSGFWKGDPQQVIAYEGLRYDWNGRSPCATGDPVAMNWGPKTDLGLYGSGYVGMLAAVLKPTSVPGILQIDCLATDFFRDKAWPTFLCYNPYPEERRFEFAAGNASSDIYDVLRGEFVRKSVRGAVLLSLPPDSAGLFVVAPTGSRLERKGGVLFLGGYRVE